MSVSIAAPMSRLLAAAALAPCAADAFAAPPSVDSQFWNELDATHGITADLSATAIFTTRLGDDLPNPALAAAGLQIDYRIGSWTATATGYEVAVRNAQTGAWTRIWLPAAAVTYETAIGPVGLSDRSRVEQLEGIPGSPTRYRNRLSADWHLPGVPRSTDLFVADEIFYDFSRDRWTRNRAQAGVQFNLAANTRLQTFYLRQNNTYGVPGRLNVLGITLQLYIP